MVKNLPVMQDVKSLQLCPALCDPIDGSPTGSPIPGILQARALKWVAISFSNEVTKGVKFTETESSLVVISIWGREEWGVTVE